MSGRGFLERHALCEFDHCVTRTIELLAPLRAPAERAARRLSTVGAVRRLVALPGELADLYTEGWDRAERSYARLERAEAERAALALERDGLAAELQKVGAECAGWKEAHGEASRRAESLAARVAQLGAAADQAGERAARAESERARVSESLHKLSADLGRYKDAADRAEDRATLAEQERQKLAAERAMLEGRIAHQRAQLLKVRRAVGVALVSLRPRPDQKPPDVETALYHLEPLAPLETADDVGGAPAPDLTKPPRGALVPAIGHDLTIHHVRPDDPTRTLCGMLCRGFEDGSGLRHGVDFSAGGAVAEVCGEPGERAAQIRKRVADGDRASVGDFACGGCADVEKGWSLKGAADGT